MGVSPSTRVDVEPIRRRTLASPLAACSWSGGKDCCLAFHRAVPLGLRPDILLTMLIEDGRRSRSNGIPISVLRAQATALGVRLLAFPTSWSEYEQVFHHALDQVRRLGVSLVVFGDLAGAAHREWNETMCSRHGLVPLLPLWGEDPQRLLLELDREDHEARIIAVKADVLGPQYLGRRVDAALGRALAERGLDPAGERGEYHTVVVQAPEFASALRVRFHSASRALRRGYWHCEVALQRH